MRRFLFENGLSIFFGVLFVGALVGQSFAGQRVSSSEAAQHGGDPISWWDYVRSPDFGGAVLENWQSEFLQFSLFIVATIWLVQKGSNESKPSEDTGLESNRRQKIGDSAVARSPRLAMLDDWRTRIYENSLLIVMTLVFFGAWFGQSLNNWRTYNAMQLEHDGVAMAWTRYIVSADFWEKSLQNWQSEFLAIGTMVVFTIFLRQRGSPESKPVGAPHDETGSSG